MAAFDHSIKDVEKVVKFDGTVKNVDITRLTAPGENYLSLVLKVDFGVENDGQSTTISSVAKRLPKSSLPFMMLGHSMRNEIEWYSEIVPLLGGFAKENNIDLDVYPEHYGSRYSLDPEKKKPDDESVLILENLIPKGYQNDDRYIGFDLNTSKAALKALALFHALPIAIKIKKPELYKVLEDYLEKSSPPHPPGDLPGTDGHNESPGPKPPVLPPGFTRLEETLLNKLETIPDLAPSLPKLKELFKKTFMGPMADKILADEPWNTFQHNDYWVNNIMVNHSNEEKPLIKIVDFQMCTYGSYAKDLVFFLLSSVNNDIAKEYMDDLLRFYYDEFTTVLRKANVDEELTYGDYLEAVNQAATRAEVGHSLIFSTIIFGEKGTGVDLAVEEFNPFVHIPRMIENMSQLQKEKIMMMVSESVKRNWL